jgi:glycosyltransferase involved in cell wall biosynthesis
MTLVAIDADVLGRRRTGDETYVENLLRELPAAAPELRFAAITRRPDLVPAGVEAIELRARSQELRMALSMPRLLRRLAPGLSHFQHALPLAAPRAVVTVHDLSFERDPSLMPWKDRQIFKRVVPRAARAAAHVLAVSERTRRDLVELYGIDESKVTVTPHGVDPAFAPQGDGGTGGYVLFVGAIQERKDPRAVAGAARQLGLPLVVVGPERDEQLARELERLGADLRGYVEKEELAQLYRDALCLVLPSRYEGFGLPVLEAMACGTPVVARRDDALVEVAGDAAVYAEGDDLPGAILQAVERRAELRAAGLARAQRFSWAETARRTAAVYREVLAR